MCPTRLAKNFAADMTAGIAYVLDVDNVLYKNLNKAMISIEKFRRNKCDKKNLHDLIRAHAKQQAPNLVRKVLADFD